jgi:exopolysaccharide production protein ExoZ
MDECRVGANPGARRARLVSCETRVALASLRRHSSSPLPSVRFNYIQILRFLAAAGVLLYHGHYYVGELVWKTPLTRAFDFHFSWGVALFFAISGFVVSHSLTFTTPGRFLVLRLIRIYPAFWLAAAIVIAVRGVQGGHPFTGGLVPALTLIPVGGADYPLGGVEWSLVYEVFFYALLAAVALVPARNAREWAMVAWLAAIAAMRIFGPIRATSFTPSLGAIAFSAFNLTFIAGVLAYSWFRRVAKLPLVPLVCVVPLALFAAGRANSAEIQLVFQAVGFAALVLAAAELSRRRDASAANPFVKLGDWSYALYLVHVPVITGVLAAAQFAATNANAAFVAVVLVALVAGSAYGIIETRLYRRNRALLNRYWPKRDVSPGAADA